MHRTKTNCSQAMANKTKKAKMHDQDGLTPSVLEARFEHRIAVSEWLVNHAYLFVNIIKQRNCSVIMALPCLRCKCKQCSDETLADALEFRCCREVTNAKRQLAISRNTKITALWQTGPCSYKLLLYFSIRMAGHAGDELECMKMSISNVS